MLDFYEELVLIFPQCFRGILLVKPGCLDSRRWEAILLVIGFGDALAKTVVGICDWGIGGLGFYRLLHTERPDVDVVYIGDQGSTPYGMLPVALLRERVYQVLNAFERQGISRVIVACNAASTILPSLLSENRAAPKMDVTGVIDPTLRYLRQSAHRRIGIVGGERTILSEAYAAPLRAIGKSVQQRIAQPLSGLIEQGRAGEPATAELVRQLLESWTNLDALILACTHYVALEAAIAGLLPNVQIIDPAAITWQEVKQDLPPLSDSAQPHYSRFFTTGDPERTQRQAQAVFGVTCDFEALSLSS